MTQTPSESELMRIVDAVGTATLDERPHPGLRFAVDGVLLTKGPIGRLVVKSSLHFHDKGSPHCCGEPVCHLGVGFATRVAERVRGAMNSSHRMAVEFDEIAAVYHPGATFDVGGAPGSHT